MWQGIALGMGVGIGLLIDLLILAAIFMGVVVIGGGLQHRYTWKSGEDEG